MNLTSFRTVRDPTGRVVIEEKDDRGCRWPILQSQPSNVLGIGVFTEILRCDTPRARRGHVVVSASVTTNAGFTGQFVAIELNFLGYIGASPSVMMSTALDANIPLVEYRWEDPETFTALGIEARQIVNGIPSSVTTGIDVLNFTVAGAYWT